MQLSYGIHLIGVHPSQGMHLKCCAQQTGMHIVVLEALLVAIYLTEKKDVYIPIRSTSLPEATIVQLSLDS